MARRLKEILILALVAVCLAFVLADSAFWYVRLDLTRSKAFTISPVSKAILGRIPQQVHITYFLSDTLRSLSPAPGRVIDFLREYAAASRGRVAVAVVDPEAAGLAESARRFSVFPQQIQVVQHNEQRTIQVYSGLVIEYLDRYTTLPAVFSADTLEYSLSLGVRKLLSGRRISVGVLIGRSGRSLQGNYSSLATGLSRDYSLHEIQPGALIPPEVDALLVLGGEELGPAELRPVDAYLMGGGRVLFAAKGLRVETAREFRAEAVGRSLLLELIEGYGVRVERSMVLDTACRDYRLPQQVSGQIAWQSLGRYPPWVSIRSANVSRDNPITASFSGLDLLWPSPLEVVKKGPAGPSGSVSAQPLVRSSDSSWLMRPPLLIDPYRVPQAGGGAAGPENRQVLAFALSGSFPSGFPAAGQPARSRPTRMVVVGDDDFATDLMLFSDSPYNVFFLENCVLWLSGNEDLLAIKTRGQAAGRLDRIENRAVRAGVMRAAELLNMAVLPLAVLAFGVVRWLRRREKPAERRQGRGREKA